MKHLLPILILLLAASAAAQDTVQGNSATFTWTAASGPVAKYAVFVSRNNAGFTTNPEQTTSTNEATITGVDGERIEVQVAARDVDNKQSPLMSLRSEIVYFSVPPEPLGRAGQPVLVRVGGG